MRISRSRVDNAADVAQERHRDAKSTSTDVGADGGNQRTRSELGPGVSENTTAWKRSMGWAAANPTSSQISSEPLVNRSRRSVGVDVNGTLSAPNTCVSPEYSNEGSKHTNTFGSLPASGR